MVRFDCRSIDVVFVMRPGSLAYLIKHLFPHAFPRPTTPTVVKHSRGAIPLRAIAPADSSLQSVDNPADNTAVIDPPRGPRRFRLRKNLNPPPRGLNHSLIHALLN